MDAKDEGVLWQNNGFYLHLVKTPVNQWVTLFALCFIRRDMNLTTFTGQTIKQSWYNEQFNHMNTKGRLCRSIVLYSFISINLVCPLELLPSVIYVGLFKTKKIKPSRTRSGFFLTHQVVFHDYQKLNCQTTVKQPTLFQSAENVSVILQETISVTALRMKAQLSRRHFRQNETISINYFYLAGPIFLAIYNGQL